MYVHLCDAIPISAAPSAIDEELKHALKGVRHERPEVRPYALKALLKLLKSNQASAFIRVMVGTMLYL